MTSELPVLQRLALSYAPGDVRNAWLAFFALDTRLAGFVRAASEPITAQLRLAWWREMLEKPATHWPEGEPLLACLASWNGQHARLSGLVDGWEAMVADTQQRIAALAEGRSDSFAAIAEVLGQSQDVPLARQMGCNWAMCDLASKLTDPEEAEGALALAQQQDWSGGKLSRPMRPLAVLHALAERSQRKRVPLSHLPGSAMLTAMRVGLFGR